jgi:hypothetical protein
MYIVIAACQNLNPLNAKLNPICHLLALLEAHPILHISRIRVNLLIDPRRRDRYVVPKRRHQITNRRHAISQISEDLYLSYHHLHSTVHV